VTNENPDKKEKPMTALHTIATALIAGGTNVKAVSERLGHSKAAGRRERGNRAASRR
jgi:site-specific recombinase XerD